MTHYLTKESCKIEKKHYSIIIRFVNAWEEQILFWHGTPGFIELCERQFSEMITEMLVRINAARQKISSAFFGKPDFGKIIKIDGEGMLCAN